MNALKETAKQIDSGCRISRGLREVCGTYDELTGIGGSRGGATRLPESLLFPLQTNDQQREIVSRLAGKPGVLVQGPPGTGKSHTIVNIVSHFLALGLRELVTSQTPRALQVLREKMPDTIRPLSVSVLGDDTTSLDSLREAVQQIQRECISWDAQTKAQDIAGLEQQRGECEYALRQLQRRQRELREIEIVEHRVSDTGYVGKAAEIVQRLNGETGSYNWLEDEISEVDRFPSTVDTLRRAVTFWRANLADVDRLLPLALPPIARLPDPETFRRAIDTEQQFRNELTKIEADGFGQRILVLGPTTEAIRIEIRKICDQAIRVRYRIQQMKYTWTGRVIGDAIVGRDVLWAELLHRTDNTLKLIEIAQKDVGVDIEPEAPKGVSKEQLFADTTDLLEHFNAGGRLRGFLFRPAVVKRCRYLWSQFRFQGRLCADPATLTALHKVLIAFRSSRETNRLWSVQADFENFADQSLTLCRVQLVELSQGVRSCLELEQYRRNAVNLIGSETHRLLSTEATIWPEQLRLAVASDAANQELELAKRVRQELLQKIPIPGKFERPHPGVVNMLAALQGCDASRYEAHYHEVYNDTVVQQQLREHDKTFAGLAKIAPLLVHRIRNAETTDELLDNQLVHLLEAWNWRRGLAWFRRFQAEHIEADLSHKIVDCERKLLGIIGRLTSMKAWQACMIRLQENREQQAALTAWEQAVRKIGKGTGKYAETHRRTARAKLHECRASIPSWIMPLHRVVEQIDMLAETFDVVIVDEASQTGPEGLLLSYLAKQCIIVGDDQQISPEAVGINQSEVHKLQQKWLPEFPHSELLDPTSSLFDQASLRFGVPVTLTEHFRCMPEIIRFSNDLCYSGTPLIPLRQYPPNRLVPIQVRHVTDGCREGQGTSVINRPEAYAIVYSIKQCLNDPRYDGKTMGVITLQGKAQAKLIEGMLLETLGSKPFVERRLVCGDAYSFQGDERDVIFLSLVAAMEGPGRFGALTKFPDQRRFNVAASRARDQMWLFHSVGPENCHPSCMRRKLLEFCYNPAPAIGDCDLSRCESDFERDVARILIERRYRVLPQFELAGKRIDLVVEGLRSRLAVECDGDRWHGPERYESDMARQRMLERCGMRFQRVRGSSFYANRIASLQPIFEALGALGIEPMPVVCEPPFDADWFAAVSFRELKANAAKGTEPIVETDFVELAEGRSLFEEAEVLEEPLEFEERPEQKPSVTFRAEIEVANQEISGFENELVSTTVTAEIQTQVNVTPLTSRGTANNDVVPRSIVIVEETLDGFTRMELVAAVLETLRKAPVPKKAIELVQLLRQESQFKGVIRKDVNSILYGVLLKQGLANVDSSNRWQCTVIPE